jgi:hypothetical protein
MTIREISYFLALPAMALAVSACSSGSSGDSPHANQPPSLSGAPPPFAMLDLYYSFRPASSDSDGDPLTFAIMNIPSWATFDEATGQLIGLPSIQHVGTYPDISISASDGQASAELPMFDIEVVATAAGSLSLTWTPPTQSADGSSLNDLASYRIRWGTQTGDHPNLQEVNNPGIASTVIDGLAPGSYYFTVSAVDSSDNESQASNEASGAVP